MIAADCIKGLLSMEFGGNELDSWVDLPYVVSVRKHGLLDGFSRLEVILLHRLPARCVICLKRSIIPFRKLLTFFCMLRSMPIRLYFYIYPISFIIVDILPV